MADASSFHPILRPSTGTLGQSPGAKAPASASAPEGFSFSDELNQALGEAQESNDVQAPSLAADQRLNELRADLNQVRLRATQLQAFQAHAAQLYQAQMRDQ